MPSDVTGLPFRQSAVRTSGVRIPVDKPKKRDRRVSGHVGRGNAPRERGGERGLWKVGVGGVGREEEWGGRRRRGGRTLEGAWQRAFPLGKLPNRHLPSQTLHLPFFCRSDGHVADLKHGFGTKWFQSSGLCWVRVHVCVWEPAIRVFFLDLDSCWTRVGLWLGLGS